jgi:hypothetical protein
MKKSTLAYWFAFLLICCLILWCLNRHHSAASKGIPIVTNIVDSVVQASSNEYSPVTNTTERIPTPEEFAATRPEREKAKRLLEENELNTWRTPIEFYGRVIDESNNVVSGAQIDFSCNDLSKAGTTDYHTTSDGNGFFSLQNVTGKLLVIAISKDGYYTSKSDNNSFEYGDSHVTAYGKENPIVFHLRKKYIGADLIHADYPGFAHIAQLKHDGTPVELDLFQGNQVANGAGQLKLEFWRDLSDRNAKVFDWKLQISVPGGGLVETDEEFPFDAPDNGYQASLIMDMSTNAANWQGNLKTKYYFQLPDGKYGRFDLEFLPYNGVFTLSSFINPSGSRNLEPK